MQETQVWFLGWADPLEEEMAIHSSTMAWKIPWTEEPGRLQSMGLQRVGHDWATSLSLSYMCIYMYMCVCAHVCLLLYKFDKAKSQLTLKRPFFILTNLNKKGSCCAMDRGRRRYLKKYWGQPGGRGRGKIVAPIFTVISAGGNGQVRQAKQVGIISAGFGVQRLSFGD